MRRYEYRLGAHGEHCVDVGALMFSRLDTIARAATAEDAKRMVEELNKLAESKTS